MNVDMPAPVFLVISKIIMVATFDLPYVSMKSIPKVYQLPNDEEILPDAPENLKNSLDLLGYSSAQISSSLGSGFLVILCTIIGLLLILATLPFIGI